MKTLKKYYFSLLFLIILFFAFFKLGVHPIYPWDEARVGVSSIEMLQNGDFVNIHYRGKPDDWNAKPPLLNYMQILSFQLLGFNEFALRLPSALAIILAFFFIYKIILLYKNWEFAFWTCLILVSGKGLIGWHVGRTGDYDASLVCLLIIGVYHFLKYLDFGKKNSIYWMGFFWGLAFWVKGPAMAVLLPGAILYAFLTKKLKELLFKKEVWLAVGLAALFPIFWFLLIHFFGANFENAAAGDNNFERLFFYDLWERFTTSEDGLKAAFSPDFFFYSLDKSLNIWNYFFFAFLLFWINKIFKNAEKFKLQLIENQENRLLLLSLCFYFPLAIFLTLAAKSNTWYLAPALPFVGIITFWGIQKFYKKYHFLKYIFITILLFTFARKFIQFSNSEPHPEIIAKNENTLKSAKRIIQNREIEQDILLYLYFQNRNIEFDIKEENWKTGDLIFIDNQLIQK